MHIQHLTLYTDRLWEMEDFYSNLLEFEVIKQENTYFTLQAGSSQLSFQESSKKCYYHFAFNIPSYMIGEACSWLKERVPLLKDGKNEIIDFANWNAEAVYFKDPGGNIVEFIARKNLKIDYDAQFDSEAIVNISEIGLPVKDVDKAFDQLNRGANISRYWGRTTVFCAAGDEEGLFILVDQAKKTWYPTDIPSTSFPLALSFDKDGKRYDLSFQKSTIELKPA